MATVGNHSGGSEFKAFSLGLKQMNSFTKSETSFLTDFDFDEVDHSSFHEFGGNGCSEIGGNGCSEIGGNGQFEIGGNGEFEIGGNGYFSDTAGNNIGDSDSLEAYTQDLDDYIKSICLDD